MPVFRRQNPTAGGLTPQRDRTHHQWMGATRGPRGYSGAEFRGMEQRAASNPTQLSRRAKYSAQHRRPAARVPPEAPDVARRLRGAPLRPPSSARRNAPRPSGFPRAGTLYSGDAHRLIQRSIAGDGNVDAFDAESVAAGRRPYPPACSDATSAARSHPRPSEFPRPRVPQNGETRLVKPDGAGQECEMQRAAEGGGSADSSGRRSVGRQLRRPPPAVGDPTHPPCSDSSSVCPGPPRFPGFAAAQSLARRETRRLKPGAA